MAWPMDDSSSYPIGSSPLTRVPPPWITLASRSSPDRRATSSAARSTSAQPSRAAERTNTAIVPTILFRIFTEASFFQEVFDLLVTNLIGRHPIHSIPILLGNAGFLGIGFRSLVQPTGSG